MTRCHIRTCPRQGTTGAGVFATRIAIATTPQHADAMVGFRSCNYRQLSCGNAIASRDLCPAWEPGRPGSLLCILCMVVRFLYDIRFTSSSTALTATLIHQDVFSRLGIRGLAVESTDVLRRFTIDLTEFMFALERVAVACHPEGIMGPWCPEVYPITLQSFSACCNCGARAPDDRESECRCITLEAAAQFVHQPRSQAVKSHSPARRRCYCSRAATGQ